MTGSQCLRKPLKHTEWWSRTLYSLLHVCEHTSRLFETELGADLHGNSKPVQLLPRQPEIFGADFSGPHIGDSVAPQRGPDPELAKSLTEAQSRETSIHTESIGNNETYVHHQCTRARTYNMFIAVPIMCATRTQMKDTIREVILQGLHRSPSQNMPQCPTKHGSYRQALSQRIIKTRQRYPWW